MKKRKDLNESKDLVNKSKERECQIEYMLETERGGERGGGRRKEGGVQEKGIQKEKRERNGEIELVS